MKESTKFHKRHEQLRRQSIAAIMLLVKKHKDIEMPIEFTASIFYGQGIDDDDNAPEIDEITESGLVVIYHQGNEIERIKLELLSTDLLVKIIGGLEESFSVGLKSIKK